MKNKQIIVLGIYRSGTSLISGTLHALGIDVGDKGELKNQYNPWGYWEDEECVKLTTKLRDKCGKIFYTVDKTDIEKVINDPEANQWVKEYIEKKKGTWAVKDPKIVPFWELFLKYLDNPYVIFIRRERDSVIKSWSSMKEREDPKHIVKAYENHLECLDNIKANIKCPYIEIDYTFHIHNPKDASQKIADFIGVPNNEEAVNFCAHYSLSGKI